ncbi:MAG: RNA polymerase sigma factor [Bacteroidota bacterium]
MKPTEELIEQCIAGKRKEQEHLYKMLYDFLVSIAMSYSSSHEEIIDYVNKSFLKIYLNLKKYKTEVPFQAWSGKIAHNVIRDELRKQKRHKRLFSLKPESFWNHSEKVQIEEDVQKNEDQEWLNINLNALPNKTREIFTLYAIKGYGHKEISHMMTISEGTSHWHVNQAKTKLKEMYNSQTLNLKHRG